ncbi:hypothetical protein B0H14DRAFT_2584606 [Mycena olivaceomarginata]|nr:hypothetical protein B0H14DRAFT_2584606 [Mycena olivaceomarginata]
MLVTSKTSPEGTEEELADREYDEGEDDKRSAEEKSLRLIACLQKVDAKMAEKRQWLTQRNNNRLRPQTKRDRVAVRIVTVHRRAIVLECRGYPNGTGKQALQMRSGGKKKGIQLAIAPPNYRVVEEQLIIIPQSAGLCAHLSTSNPGPNRDRQSGYRKPKSKRDRLAYRIQRLQSFCDTPQDYFEFGVGAGHLLKSINWVGPPTPASAAPQAAA